MYFKHTNKDKCNTNLLTCVSPLTQDNKSQDTTAVTLKR